MTRNTKTDYESGDISMSRYNKSTKSKNNDYPLKIIMK